MVIASFAAVTLRAAGAAAFLTAAFLAGAFLAGAFFAAAFFTGAFFFAGMIASFDFSYGKS
ncbi:MULTISPECIES: hypothetical protein [unclassified Ketobacter]|uniref:hypothetical protein n=1 Tax=unclassified Ketobacter TaxID=2639109 RepID=UPI0025C6691E|nr:MULTISPECIES: hypothetical protein [unclassified Ketobacter]